MESKLKRHINTIALFFLLGLIGTIAVSMILAVTVNVFTGGTYTAKRGEWTVTAAYAPSTSLPAAVRVISEYSSIPRSASWNPLQATGAPDTPTAGDRPTAWAATTSGGQSEWLLLTFDRPMIPAFIDVHESYHPGALTRVTLVRDDDTEIEAWSGVDPTPPTVPMGVSHIPVKVKDGPTPAVQKVKLYIGVAGLTGWNEIDAVGLVDAAGAVHWAVDASASSWYGESSYTSIVTPSVAPESLVPSWSGLTAPPRPNKPPRTRHEIHGADARGWPLLALWAPFDPLALERRYPGLRTAFGSPSQMSTAPVIPWRPIWSGLLLDGLLYGLVLWLLWSILTKPRRFFLEISRLKRGCCVTCGYDLGYDFPRGCPECGWRRAESKETPSPKPRVLQTSDPHMK